MAAVELVTGLVCGEHHRPDPLRTALGERLAGVIEQVAADTLASVLGRDVEPEDRA